MLRKFEETREFTPLLSVAISMPLKSKTVSSHIKHNAALSFVFDSNTFDVFSKSFFSRSVYYFGLINIFRFFASISFMRSAKKGTELF